MLHQIQDVSENTQTDDFVGFPLSPQQQRLLSLAEGFSIGPFQAQIKLQLHGAVDCSRLEHALILVVGRHEVLRTKFKSHPAFKSLLQVIMPEAEEHGIHISLCEQTGSTPGSLSGTRINFDLARGETLHAALLTISPMRSVLYLAVPSLCGDAKSLLVMAHE